MGKLKTGKYVGRKSYYVPVAERRAREQAAEVPVVHETDAQIRDKITERFQILGALTDAAINSDVRSLIVSGPAGLGKSFTVEQALKRWDPKKRNHTIVKGYVKATGLYKLLHQYSGKGQVIVFDDADSIFFDDVSLNMLKAVCDTTDIREVSYLAEGALIDEETGARLPKQFEFHGTIIFITNYDFDSMIEKGHKLAPHLQAFVSRSHYVDLAMKSRRDYIVRIKQVMEAGLLNQVDLPAGQHKDVLDFIEEFKDTLRELSLRMALKIGTIRKTGGTNWKSVAKVTCCRNA